MSQNHLSLKLLNLVINFVLLTEIKIGTPLQLGNITFNISTTIYDVLPLFNIYSRLCIISTENDITTKLIEYCRHTDLPIVLSDLYVTVTDNCDSVVVIDKPAITLCGDVLSRARKSRCVYLLDSGDNCNAGRVDLESCDSAVEVVSVCLRDGSLAKLSPLWIKSMERHFTNVNVAQLLHHPHPVDLGGSTVTTAIIDYAPFLILKNLNKPDEFDGIEILLIKELALRLNFTLEYQIYKNWGAVERNGSWKGGIGQAMQDGKAEVSVANIWQIPDLYKVMDFGPALDNNQLVFLVRRPEQIEFQLRTFATIFKPFVWIFTGFGFIIVVAMYWIGISWGRLSRTESWIASVLTVFGHFLMTTSHSRTSDGNTRYTLTGWSIFSLLLTTSLSTGIVSRLILPMYTPRVDSIKQLVEGHYYWSVQYYARFITTQSKSSFFNFNNKWHYQFEKEYVYLTTAEIENKARSENKICFLVQTFGYNFLVVNIDGLVGNSVLTEYRLANEPIGEPKVTFGVKKNSPLLQPLRAMTSRLLTAGFLELWQKEVVRRWPEYDNSDILVERDDPTFSEHQPLPMAKLKPIFYSLLFGLGIAFLVFIVELTW